MTMSRKVVFAALAAILVSGAAVAQAGLGFGLQDISIMQDAQSKRASSCDPDWRKGNADARPIPPGETLVLAELEGPGTVNHIWNTIASNERGYSRLLVLRMYWDGEEKPSVECPIGDFFGIGHGIDKPFVSLPIKVSSDGRGRNCYWPMPFAKSARITVTNEGKQPTNAFYYYIDWQKLPQLPPNTAYFHAMYRQEFPTVSGQNYLLADIEGRGQYVGTVLSVRQQTASWWGEGDDFFFIDGEAEPSLRGTGSEDYFCDGWGFRQQDGPFYGAPLVEGMRAGDHTTVYRWHITDPVRFTKSLRVEIEHMGVTFNSDNSVRSGFEERSDDFSSVAYWYQAEPHKPWPELPVGYARMYFDYGSVIEAESLIPKSTATEGPIEPQNIPGASGGSHLFWRPGDEGKSLSVPFDVVETSSCSLMILFTTSFDYGIYQVSLDDQPLGEPVDLYSSGISSIERFFPPQPLTAGTHTLTFKNLGKNPASKGYFFGVDGLLITKQ